MKQLYPSGKSNLGFTFSHKQFSATDGFPNLIVYLRPEPSDTHFDPEKITYSIVKDHHPEKITFHYPVQMSGKQVLAAGRIILEDRKSRRVEFFSFGGTLTIAEDGDTVVCKFVSTAPIFVLEESEGPRALFAEDAEIILAERMAKNPQYGEKLVAVKPFDLFVSLLMEIKAKVEKMPYHRVHKLSQLHNFVVEENKLLLEYEMFPDEITPIAELL